MRMGVGSLSRRQDDLLWALHSGSGDWVWCLHCERAFKACDVSVRISYGEEMYFCPYDDCGGTLLDFSLWKDMRSGKSWGGAFVGRLPEVPVYGERYRLYS